MSDAYMITAAIREVRTELARIAEALEAGTNRGSVPLSVSSADATLVVDAIIEGESK